MHHGKIADGRWQMAVECRRKGKFTGFVGVLPHTVGGKLES
jgi:hypothetical protein